MDQFRGHNFEDENFSQFLRNVHDVIMEEALKKGTSRKTNVVNYADPEQLQEKLDLAIGKKGADHEKLLELCKTVIHYSVQTSSTRFYNQLYSGMNGYGLAGAWLTESLNTNIHTFEVAPVFVVMEKMMIQKLCGIIGFENGDGVFGPGGSFVNILAVNIARYHASPDIKKTGLYGHKRLKVYASAEAHYSFSKAASFLGLGVDSVVYIETNERGIMKTDKLTEMINLDIEKGEQPMMVAATAGTTVLGAYDDLTALADVCQKHKLWLHCDACWGGGVLLSKKHRYLMSGAASCDSISWNFHKMHGAPLQCSAILVKHKGLLEACHEYNADYLFQPDKFYDVSYDIGDKTVQCGRKPDVLKLWLQWKAIGDEGMEERVDKAFENAKYLLMKLQATEGFRLVMPEFQCTNICFWYVPEILRNQTETEEWWERMKKVAPKIKEGMVKKGSLMIGYTPLKQKGNVNFFRIIILNTLCEKKDMDYVIEEIDRLGRNLKV